MDIKKAMAGFADPTIYIFFGGFALATALHMQRLDRKIAVSLLRLSRGNMKVAVLMLFAVTAFLSMWISNTATAAMMLPLAMGMMSHLDQEKNAKPMFSSYSASPTAPVSVVWALWSVRRRT